MTVRLAPSFEVVSVPSDAVIEFAVERIITRLKRADGDQSPASGRRYPTRTCCRTCCRTCSPSQSIRRHRKHGPKATQPVLHFHDLASSLYLRTDFAQDNSVIANWSESKSEHVTLPWHPAHIVQIYSCGCGYFGLHRLYLHGFHKHSVAMGSFRSGCIAFVVAAARPIRRSWWNRWKDRTITLGPTEATLVP